MLFVSFLPPANEVCEGNVFTGVCQSTGGGLGLCPGGVSVWGFSGQEGVSVWGSLCPGVSVRGGLYPGKSLSRRSLSKGVSVQRRGSLSRGLCPRVSIRILLECILVIFCPFFSHRYRHRIRNAQYKDFYRKNI